MIRIIALVGFVLAISPQDGNCKCQNGGNCHHLRHQLTDDKNPVVINDCWKLCLDQNAQACQWQQFKFCEEFNFFGIKTWGNCDDHSKGRCFRFDRDVIGGDGQDVVKNKCYVIREEEKNYDHIHSCQQCLRQPKGSWQGGHCTYDCKIADVSCWTHKCPETNLRKLKTCDTCLENEYKWQNNKCVKRCNGSATCYQSSDHWDAENPCPASWEPWSSYGSCNCTIGKKTRTRTCNQAGRGRCRGEATQQRSCNDGCNTNNIIFVYNQKNERKQCQFPWYYQNQYYTTCIKDEEDPESMWCSTKTDSNNYHMGGIQEWGYCNDDSGNNNNNNNGVCPYNQSSRASRRDYFICENGEFCKRQRCCKNNNSHIVQCPEKKKFMCQYEQRGDRRCVKGEWKCDRFGGLMPYHMCPHVLHPITLPPPTTPSPHHPCRPQCNESFIGNGRCDKVCNHRSCNFDGGDCRQNGKQKCPFLCTLLKNDGRCDNKCNIPRCNFDGGDCKNNTCPRKCQYKGGDGHCDPDCNVQACQYDNGDCSKDGDCPVWCHYSQSNGVCDKACNIQSCAYDGTDCEDAPYVTTPSPSPNDCAQGCQNNIIGDGVCDPQCNILQCNFDNGDCENPIHTSTSTPSPPSNQCPRGTSYTLSVEEQCQQCTCNPRNGNVQCRGGQRIRKEVHDLTTEEFNRFAEGIVHIQRNGGWEHYVDIHTVPGWTAAHGTRSHFFHWHRQFLYQLETEIMTIMNDCSIAIPYWNWALDPNPSTSRVWAADYFGSNNRNTDSASCVETGPFSEFEQNSAQDWWIGRNENEDFRGCLRRQWTETQFPSIARLEILKNDEFQRFQDELEIDHGVVHCAIGGHMCIGGLSAINRNILTGISTYDPMFFSHHAMIDYIFAQRQEGRSEESNADRVGHSTLLGFRHSGTGDTMSLDHVQNSNLLKVSNHHTVPWGVIYQESDVLQRIVNGETDAIPIKIRLGNKNNNGDVPPVQFAPVPKQEAQPVCTIKEALCMITYLNKHYPNYEQEVTPCCPPNDITGRIKILEMILVGKTAEVAAILEEISNNLNEFDSRSILKSYEQAKAAADGITKQIQDLQREYERKTALYTRRQSTAPKSRVDKAICMSATDLVQVYMNQESDIGNCLSEKTQASLDYSSRSRVDRDRIGPESVPDVDLDLYLDESAINQQNATEESTVNNNNDFIK